MCNHYKKVPIADFGTWSRFKPEHRTYWMNMIMICVLIIFRFAILRMHSHGLVTFDLQCLEGDDGAQVDNVS